MLALSLWVGFYFWWQSGSPLGGTGVRAHGEMAPAMVWQTMLFTTLVFTQLFLAFALRSTTDSVWRKGLFSNPPLIVDLTLTGGLQVAVIDVPFLQDFFHTTALTASRFAICLATGRLVYLIVECSKLCERRH